VDSRAVELSCVWFNLPLDISGSDDH